MAVANQTQTQMQVLVVAGRLPSGQTPPQLLVGMAAQVLHLLFLARL
jgi:hypothetical protein